MSLASDSNEIVAKESFYAPEARILVVDDTRMNLIVIKGLLKDTGIHVDTADSGRSCLTLAKRNRYNIIFLDIKMPEMDGFETLRRLSEMDANKNKGVPVIALSANAISGTKQDYIEKGFCDYLQKPVAPDMLEKTILEYLPGELVREKDAQKKDASASDSRVDKVPVIAGLDTAMGVRSCGTVKTFQKVLKNFHITAKDRILELEHYIQTGDYKNYTIKVHALKSSARLIGSVKLSDMARYLEECGNNDNIAEIKHKTTDLLEHYRELTQAIGAYINEKEHTVERPLIEQCALMDALRTINEFVEVFDFDSADSVMKMLDEYAVPEDYHEAVLKIKVLLTNVERDNIISLIKALEERTRPKPAEKIEIPDIDSESALWALGGSVNDYINIMKVFSEDEKERLEQMDECIRTENIDLYTIYVHSLKGSAAIIGAADLSGLAQLLETAGKEGDIGYIRANHGELSVKTNRIIENLIYFLSRRGNLDDKAKEPGSKEFLRKNLEKIGKALMDYEMSIAEESLNLLNNFKWSETATGIISQIRQKLQAFDYDDARLLSGKLLEMEEK